MVRRLSGLGQIGLSTQRKELVGLGVMTLLRVLLQKLDKGTGLEIRSQLSGLLHEFGG